MNNEKNSILEQLKKIQAEQSKSKKRDTEIMSRLAQIESGIVRIDRDEANNYGEIIHDRHVVDQIKERLDRIEKRLELN